MVAVGYGVPNVVFAVFRKYIMIIIRSVADYAVVYRGAYHEQVRLALRLIYLKLALLKLTRMLTQVCTGRKSRSRAHAADIAEAAYFLGTDSASYITGQVLGVNGGYITT